MLIDISSMANASGGYIIIGINEDENGNPVETINCIDDIEADRMCDWILSFCANSIEPMISVLRVGPIKVPGRGSLIKIFIEKSDAAPHMVLRDIHRFYKRHERKITHMSVDEIKDAFATIDNLHRNMQKFYRQRKEEILSITHDQTTLVIGVIPIIVNSAVVDMQQENLRRFLKEPPDQRKNGFNLVFVDGFGGSTEVGTTLSGLKIGNVHSRRVTVMKNGYYELLANFDIEGLHKHVGRVDILRHLPLIELTVSFFRAAKTLTKLLDIQSRVVSFLLILNVDKYGFVDRLIDNLCDSDVRYCRSQHVEIGPDDIRDISAPDSVAKSYLDAVWNAFDFDEAPFFENRQFIPPARK